MTCYTTDYSGQLQVDSEIDEIVWLTTNDIDNISPVVKLLFADLKEKEVLI